MKKACLACTVGAVALACTGWVHAATVPVQPAAAPLQAPAAEAVVETVAEGVVGTGRQVLNLGKQERRPAPAKVTAVPLPGALWLFGSALLAFLGISGRHKL